MARPAKSLEPELTSERALAPRGPRLVRVGERIRQERLKRRLSQANLSKLSGIPTLSISRHECAYRMAGSLRILPTVKRLSDAMGGCMEDVCEAIVQFYGAKGSTGRILGVRRAR